MFAATLVPGIQPRDGHMRSNVLQLADNVNCSRDENDHEILSCLQDADANQILAKQLNPYWFGPTNDHLISTTPFFYTTAENSFYKGIFNKVPLIAGFNAEDGINKAFKFILVKCANQARTLLALLAPDSTFPRLTVISSTVSFIKSHVRSC